VLPGIERLADDRNPNLTLLGVRPCTHPQRIGEKGQWPARAIESQLTVMSEDERAISVSGYVHRGQVKYAEHAFNKTVVYKGKARNHLVEQVENFRVGDKDNKREDDLLDTFCYGIAVALGNEKGF
jgi:hypothetical protein